MLNDVLEVGILIPTRPMSRDEIDYLIKQEYTANQAISSFLAHKISWQDCLDILEICGVDIDEYLIQADNNCSELWG